MDEKNFKQRPLPGTSVNGTAWPLGDGHCLVVDVTSREGREVDSRGEVVRRMAASDVRGVVRLVSGDLVALVEGNNCSFLREANAGGKVVWELKGPAQPRSLAACLPLIGLGF
jgi:hypothetical protein